VSHGGGLRCTQHGCERVRKVRGMCAIHGGVNKKKLCGVTNCTAKDIGGGLCSAHGGVRLCADDGCSKRAKVGTGLSHVAV
jgi:hypothetical protein